MKIKIIKDDLGGPGIFLIRLERELKERGLIDNLNPDVIFSTSYVKTNRKFILRLDGINFEKFTTKEFSNFLRYRRKLIFLAKINDCISDLISGESYNKIITPYLTKFLFYLRNRKQTLGIKHADYIIYQTRFSRDSYKHFCQDYGEGKNTIIFNGIDLTQFSPKKNNKEKSNGPKLRLLSSGHFRPWKRLQDSLILLKNLIKEIPETKLTVIGKVDSQTMGYLERIIKRNNLREYVEFLGMFHFDSLPPFYANADIFLHPAWHDACPNVVIESLACGTPVICSSTGGTAELVDDGGIIVDEDYEFGFKEYYNFKKIPQLNYDKYLEAILKIYNNLDYYSEKARKRAEEKLDIKKISDEYIKVAKQILTK